MLVINYCVILWWFYSVGVLVARMLRFMELFNCRGFPFAIVLIRFRRGGGGTALLKRLTILWNGCEMRCRDLPLALLLLVAFRNQVVFFFTTLEC